MTDRPPFADLQGLIDDMRVARPHMAARRADRQSERLDRDRVTHYAIDTNILYLIGAPVRMVVSHQRLGKSHEPRRDADRAPTPHVGSLFRSDPPRLHALFGVLIARYIGFSLDGSSSLLLPTALWHEVETMFAHFSTMDDPETILFADELFEQMMAPTIDALLRQSTPAPGERDAIRSAVRRLVRQTVGRQQGLETLRDLLRNGRLDSLAARPVHVLQRRSRNLGDWQEEQRRLQKTLEAAWDAALYDAGKLASSHRQLDAEALTQVQMRNLFAEQQGSGERVIYITADSSVLRAAQTIPLEGSGRSFAELFVRHPIAFLDDIDLRAGAEAAAAAADDRSRELAAADAAGDPPPGQPVPRGLLLHESALILDWMDVLLAQSTDLRNRTDSGAADEIRDSWERFCDVQADQLLVHFGLRTVEARLQAELASGNLPLAIERLQEAVTEAEAGAWRRCFDVAIELALRQDPSNRPRPLRSSPPICFEAWPAAGAAIEQFKLWGAAGVSTREELDRIRRQLDTGEDDTGYAYYLASAAFFAARGDWEPAAGLAAFSRSVASRQAAGRRRGANGREASFFEAVARRHLARRVEDLVRPRELLAACETIYGAERSGWPGPMGIVPERFHLEKLDIDQTEMLFDWHAGGTREPTQEKLLAQFGSYRDLQQQLARQVDDWLMTDMSQPLLGSTGLSLVQCEVRTIVSALLLLGIDRLPMAALPVDPVGRMIERLTRLQTAAAARLKDMVPRSLVRDGSVLAELAVTVAGALVGQARGRQADRAALRSALDLLRNRPFRRQVLYPFEYERFAAMQTIMRRSLRD